jgi:hypothetical protein
VNGETLGFCHFTGIDSGAHEFMAAKYAEDNESSQNLIKWYKNELSTTQLKKKPWRYSYFNNGCRITSTHRKIYYSINNLSDIFPNPYDTTHSDCFYQWYRYRSLIFRLFPNLIIFYNYQSRQDNKSFVKLLRQSISQIGLFGSIKMILRTLTK